jgi:hypothetical protein
MAECTNKYCDHGWIFIQHPLRPVIIRHEECPDCNKDGTKKHPLLDPKLAEEMFQKALEKRYGKK